MRHGKWWKTETRSLQTSDRKSNNLHTDDITYNFERPSGVVSTFLPRDSMRAAIISGELYEATKRIEYGCSAR